MPTTKKSNTTKATEAKKTRASVRPMAGANRRPSTKTAKSKAPKKTSRKKKDSAVEVLKPIKPKKLAQSIPVEVAEDNFNAAAFNDFLSAKDEAGLDFSEEEGLETHPEQVYRRPEREDLDKQGKFFRELASEAHLGQEKDVNNNSLLPSKNDDLDSSDSGHFRKSSNLYRHLVIKFVLAVGVLALIVAYFSFSKLTVLITPKTEHVGATLEFDVVNPDSELTAEDGGGNPIISGKVVEITLGDSKNYPAGGEELAGEEIIGKVKLINNYNKNQPLVATTRLLSPDNKLFRIKEAVNIPAGGSVEVEIYADNPGPEMAIAPTRFSIPGLWAGLQDQIYAESQEKFVFQHKIKKYIKPSDLDLATKDMASHLLAQAQRQIMEQVGDDQLVVFAEDPTRGSSTFDSKSGDVKEDFNLSATSTIVFAYFPRQTAEEMLAAKLKLSVPDDKDLIASDRLPTYTFLTYNPGSNTVSVRAEFNGLMALKGDAGIIDRAKLINLSRQQIEEYLDNFPEISSYELKLTPSFIDKAPSLVDRISVKIKSPEL